MIQNNIKKALIDKGIKNYELARLLNVSDQNIYNIMKRDKDIKISTLYKVCEALGLEIVLKDKETGREY